MNYIKNVFLKSKGNQEVYPFSLPLIKNFSSLNFNAPVTFITGENGSGKSTFIEALAVAYGFNSEGGSKNFNFATNNTHSPLHEFIRLAKTPHIAKDGYFLRAESFYNLATYVDEIDDGGDLPSGFLQGYGGKSLHHQSHGESFLSLMEHRWSGNGLYILDEPEAALSASGQLKMLKLIDLLVKEHSQFIIATHSVILTAYPQSELYEISNAEFVKKDYSQTENFTNTKYFLNNTNRVLDMIFKD